MQKVYNIVSFILLFILSVSVLSNYIEKNKPHTYDLREIVRLEQPEFFLSDYPDTELLIDALNYYNVKHPNIVYAQAVLETGNFKSRVCKEYNNLFGLYDSNKKDYYRFDHWSDSILGYINYIQYKYDSSDDYYVFLDDIGYAEDSLYVYKLKRIIDKSKLNE